MPALLVVLISGSGTNLQAIIDAIDNGILRDTKIELVISNRKAAFGLERARQAGIDTSYHNLVPYGKRFPSTDMVAKYGPAAREAYDADLAKKILNVKPSGSTKFLVVCAGWMHILSDTFLKPLADANVPTINLHPALPGRYDGAQAIERAFKDFQDGLTSSTGCMIHEVILAVDQGTPLITQEVPIEQGDTLETLETRIHDVEHDIIVKGVQIALDKISTTVP